MDRPKTPIVITTPPVTREDVAEAAKLMGVDLYKELAKDRKMNSKAAKVFRGPNTKPDRVSSGR
jgi:hypothetical protein